MAWHVEGPVDCTAEALRVGKRRTRFAKLKASSRASMVPSQARCKVMGTAGDEVGEIGKVEDRVAGALSAVSPTRRNEGSPSLSCFWRRGNRAPHPWRDGFDLVCGAGCLVSAGVLWRMRVQESTGEGWRTGDRGLCFRSAQATVEGPDMGIRGALLSPAGRVTSCEPGMDGATVTGAGNGGPWQRRRPLLPVW